MISDEMVSLLKVVEETKPDSSVPAARRDSEEGLEWQEVGSRGKSCITRRIKDQSNIVTPVQQLALGLCRYSVKSANSETSATLQPFFTLQLDIQSDTITRSVALRPPEPQLNLRSAHELYAALLIKTHLATSQFLLSILSVLTMH